MRKLILIVAVILPQFAKQALYRRLGWRIGRGVHIGKSFIDGRDVTIGDGTWIGNFNVIRRVKHLQIGSKVRIFNFNEIFGASAYYPDFPSTLIIGDEATLTSHHFVSATGYVSIGPKVIIGGRDTHIWSHSGALTPDGVATVPSEVRIGSGVYVAARATLVGCSVPDGAIVGAGSVVVKQFPDETVRVLIAGNPAVIKRRYEDVPASTPVAEP